MKKISRSVFIASLALIAVHSTVSQANKTLIDLFPRWISDEKYGKADVYKINGYNSFERQGEMSLSWDFSRSCVRVSGYDQGWRELSICDGYITTYPTLTSQCSRTRFNESITDLFTDYISTFTINESILWNVPVDNQNTYYKASNPYDNTTFYIRSTDNVIMFMVEENQD